MADEIKKPAIDIVNELKEYNIFCRPAFPPMSNFPVYSSYKEIENPIVDKFQSKGIVLPAAHNLLEKDIDYICETLIGIINK